MESLGAREGRRICFDVFLVEGVLRNFAYFLVCVGAHFRVVIGREGAKLR